MSWSAGNVRISGLSAIASSTIACRMSDRTVATRLDMSQQRYVNYVRDVTEPDFQALGRICEVLLTTPDDVLGSAAGVETVNEASMLAQRIRAAVSVMDLERLRLTASVVDVLYATSEIATRGFEADHD